MFRLKDNVDAILEFPIRPIYPICPIYPTWVLFLIPVWWRDVVLNLVCAPNSVGINFNTCDVCACLAEVERSIINSVGIIFNTHVAEGCRPQFGVPPNSVGIIFNTHVAEESATTKW